MQKGRGALARIIAGIAIVAAVIVTAIFVPVLTPFLTSALSAAASIGASLIIGGIAQLLTHVPGNQIAIRQPAMPWIIVYGRSRVGGSIVYMSLDSNRQFLNMVIVHAAHPCKAINGYWIDGCLIYFAGGANPGNGGGGAYDDGANHFDPAGNKYNYKGDVYIESRLGTETGPAFASLSSHDSNWPSTAILQGHCCTYLRCRYDQNLWTSGYPQVMFDIAGNSTIYDPRSSTTGYSENWALIVANLLQNQLWGLSCSSAEIDQTQLIAAANLCDEAVAVAGGGGGYEARYTVNGSMTAEMAPGQMLQSLSTAAAGRIVWSGGLWKIFPAGWIGPSLSFTDDDVIAPIKWMPKRKYRDLSNAVKGTFTCPTFPYAIYGPGYANNVKISGVFDGQWQTTDVPPYAQDTLHGYSSDANYAADGNIRLWMQVQFPWTISVAAAQRLMKIYLMRNRQQGAGTISFNLKALQASALDVIQLTHSRFGWTNKQLEITNYRLAVQDAQEGGSGPLIYVECDVAETDASVYVWSTGEELGINDDPSPAYPGKGIISQATMYPVTSGNRNSAIVTGVSPLTASDAGTSATVNIAAFQMQFGTGIVSFNAGSVTGLLYSTLYFVYLYDPLLDGGTVPYYVGTGFQSVVSAQGYVYVGPITTPASGGTPTGGSGPGGGCPCTTMWLNGELTADDARAGTPLQIRLGGESFEQGTVQAISGRERVPCVRIKCENGAVYEGAWDTPLHPKERPAIAAGYVAGAEIFLPTLTNCVWGEGGELMSSTFEWSKATVDNIGVCEVVKVYCGIAEFASGAEPSKLIFTHNAVPIYGK